MTRPASPCPDGERADAPPVCAPPAAGPHTVTGTRMTPGCLDVASVVPPLHEHAVPRGLVTQLGATNRAAASLALRGGTQMSEAAPVAPYLRSVHAP
jgi:hypothetical protein